MVIDVWKYVQERRNTSHVRLGEVKEILKKFGNAFFANELGGRPQADVG